MAIPSKYIYFPWHFHQSYIESGINELQKEKQLTDVTVAK